MAVSGFCTELRVMVLVILRSARNVPTRCALIFGLFLF
jgi:hypothetical protein